eukprot:Em0003g1675a
MKCGLSLNSLNVFAPFLEKYAQRVPDASHLRQLIPIIQAQELERVKKALQGRSISIIFDGTTRVCEAFAVVARYIDEESNIRQMLVAMSMIDDQLIGVTTAREIYKIIMVKLGIEDEDNIAAFMRDRASVNDVAMDRLSGDFQCSEDIKCFSHTLDHVGDKFKCETLTRFWGKWLNLFSHSRRAKKIFNQVVGVSVKSYSATRWWSKYEWFEQLMRVWGDVIKILDELKAASINEAGSAVEAYQMLTDIHTVSKLRVELAAVVDGAQPFLKACYSLEGDGPQAFEVYDEIKKCEHFIANPHFPNLSAICAELGGTQLPRSTEYIRLYHLGEDCVRPGFEYFTATIMGKLRPQLDLFKAARYLVPCRAVELGLNATLLDELKIMKVIQRGKISIHSLVQELPQYLAACDGISLSANVTIFWKERATLLPNFYALFCWYCLIQPSSAAAERVFSLLNNMFNEQQLHALQDYVETAVMLRYNNVTL